MSWLFWLLAWYRSCANIVILHDLCAVNSSLISELKRVMNWLLLIDSPHYYYFMIININLPRLIYIKSKNCLSVIFFQQWFQSFPT